MVRDALTAAEPALRPTEQSLEAKLRFLRSAAAYPGLQRAPECVETHMSWVFLLGDHVLKLKKPVRFPFLDFSTIAMREFFCREELRLNARLAPGVYLDLLALQSDGSTFALVPQAQLPGPGHTVDWLVLMRRLPQHKMLQQRLAQGTVDPADLDAIVEVLANFYRAAPKADVTASEYLARFQREQSATREVLLRPQFDLCSAGLALDRFDAALARHATLLEGRASGQHVVDGHGDLRPEHVCLLQPPVVIDCLEFNAELREVDPFDEIAFLGMECAMAGVPWAGLRMASGLANALDDPPPPGLMDLYTAHRALLRARLAMAHLLDSVVRTPQRWPALAQRYVDRALLAMNALDARPH